MRAQYFLVAVATVLLATCATLSSVNAVQVSPAARRQGYVLLRSLEMKPRGEGEEERAGGALGKVDDVVADIVDDAPSLMKMFKHWRTLTAGEKLRTAGLADLPEEKFMEVLKLYGLYKALGSDAFLARQERIKAKAHPTRT
ncbi:hypothetical protein PHYSODRAFT_355799 [Phytophthora sojae]|uniref:RxLR effector protein n=2 Tax=Phytophthora sojae TaxID=67593 RepID=G5A4J3_PHYSP|nr:hypothetical protein PHYSODRAFT_355799 [Phytophthora sojae]AEK80539.1 Avh38 [Phytophthora sojae]AEK80540.1 Avh38 [Phytophthora sojae]AEK80541.1 Avh38 [Phytophthora sojae]EGZ09594.1 hypothetical protein PHYSODRAFT_355799 [Phytophthora sojae]|eukprot:XP_009534455.1 hypothetical protein PHYSODRAFT_355799 [Phytophthora sojae]